MATAKSYTVSDLIASVKARGAVPEATGTYTDTDILRFANEEIDENLGPLILSTREEIYLTYEDITLVSGQKEYTIPYRAYGSKIRIIKPYNSGSAREGTPLSHIPLDNTFDHTNIGYNHNTRGFHLKNDKIVLVANPSVISTDKIRVYFYLRPNNLVELNKGSKITNISGNIITVSSIPDNVRDADSLDFIQSKPNFKIYAYDATATINTTAKTITFDEDVPSELEVGDYICASGETVIPQIPMDVLPVLEQSVVCKILESLGDTEGLKNAYERLNKLENRLFNLIDNRVEAPSRKVVNTNSLLRNRRRGNGDKY